MKFLFSLALLAVAGVTAQDTTCEADYIVTRCLETEQAKVDDCDTLDYDCICAAHEAVATCYNNCPNDPRARDAQSLVTIHCQNASLYGTRTATRTTASSATAAATEASATTTTIGEAESEDAEASAEGTSSTATSSAENPDNTGAAADLARNTGSVLLAVAGVVVALF